MVWIDISINTVPLFLTEPNTGRTRYPTCTKTILGSLSYDSDGCIWREKVVAAHADLHSGGCLSLADSHHRQPEPNDCLTSLLYSLTKADMSLNVGGDRGRY